MRNLGSLYIYLNKVTRATRSLHLPRSKNGDNQPETQQGCQAVAEQAEDGGDGYGVNTVEIERELQQLLGRI